MLALDAIERRAVVQGILIPCGLDVERGLYRLAVRTSDGARFEIEGDGETEALQEMVGEEIVVRGALERDGDRKIVWIRSYELIGSNALDEDGDSDLDPSDFDDED